MFGFLKNKTERIKVDEKKLQQEIEDNKEETEKLAKKLSELFNLDPKEAQQYIRDLCVARMQLFEISNSIIADENTPDKLKEFVFVDFISTLLSILIKINPFILDGIVMTLAQQGLVNIDEGTLPNKDFMH